MPTTAQILPAPSIISAPSGGYPWLAKKLPTKASGETASRLSSPAPTVCLCPKRSDRTVCLTKRPGYNKMDPPPALDGFTGPTELGGAINAPLYNNQNTYMGYKYYPFSQSQGYDPSTCAAACKAQTAYNSRHPNANGSYLTCVSGRVCAVVLQLTNHASHFLTPTSSPRMQFPKACTAPSTARRGTHPTLRTTDNTVAVTGTPSLEAIATLWHSSLDTKFDQCGVHAQRVFVLFCWGYLVLECNRPRRWHSMIST